MIELTWTEVKELEIFSVAKIYGAIGALIGLILGLLFALIGLITSRVLLFMPISQVSVTGPMVAFFSLAILLFTPIMYGVIGFISGAVCAFLYNVVASRIGGIKFQS